MPNDWDDDDFDQDDTPLVKQLRQQIKELNKTVKERDERLQVLEPQVRSASLSSILSGLNVSDPKVAKLMPKDLDVNEENVKAWLDEYGDILNVKYGEQPATTETQPAATETEGQPQAEAWQKFQAQSSNEGNLTPDTEAQQIAMLQAANAASGNADQFFAMLRGEAPIPN